MKKKVLSAMNVQKTFSNNGVLVHVLSNVNADIYAGDFTVIMGASDLTEVNSTRRQTARDY